MPNKKRSHHDPEKKLEKAKKIASQSKKAYDAYDNVTETIFRVFRWFSSLIDHILFSVKFLPLVALFLAVLFYITVNYNSDNSLFIKPLSSSKVISNVSVRARYNSESFEVSGLPTNCEVILTGDAANVNNAATRTGFCQVNLEGYTEGTHSIKMVATGYGDTVSATVTPSDALITLKRKTTGQFEVSSEYINKDKMDSRYILSEPEFLEGSKVNIRASQDTLDTIAMVRALIDVEGKNADFEAQASLVAYDKLGNVVNADIVPSTIKISAKVSSPHKTVPIVLNLIGEVPNDMAIESISMDHQTATIYASENVLNTIEQVEIEYDASTLTGDSKVVQPITLPDGVTSSDVSLVTLDVKLSELVTKTITGINVNYRNNDNNYTALEVSMTKVEVEVVGTQSNIDLISANDIFVYVDLTNAQPGVNELPLALERKTSSQYVKFELKQKSIKITLDGEKINDDTNKGVVE